MDTITNVKVLEKLFSCILPMFMCIGMGISISGCAPIQSAFKPDNRIEMEGDAAKPKSIFIFLDGTANDQKSGTNVRRLFEQIKYHKNLQTTGLYIEGVGSVKERLKDDSVLPFLGDALGKDMQTRILEGYDFIAENYKPGDKLYIFGFSRGAHQARALAGLIAYAGVPTKVTGSDSDRKKKWEGILELVKDKRDVDYIQQWNDWRPNQAPLLASEIKSDKNLDVDMQTAEITFLGIWDAVPGSSLKSYPGCKENIGIVKKYFHWIPGVSKGERYKSDSYPPIRRIGHAVSLDEKRSKFRPLLLCTVINQEYTKQSEVWFPGAHADVGGGYDDIHVDGIYYDSKLLPGISLNWMIGLLAESYTFKAGSPKVAENAKGLAHWSICDPPANVGSKWEDRQPPLNKNNIDRSYEERKRSGLVPVLVKGNISASSYPTKCPTM